MDLGVIRSPGPGLGNLLFPIARAIVGQNKFGGQVVRPTIRQIKFGTILRRERDLRTYGDLFKPRTKQDWKNWYLSKIQSSIAEGTQISQSHSEVTVVYKGLGNHFHDLVDHSEFIKIWIEQFRLNNNVNSMSYDIGIHIRQGDFGNNNNNNYSGHNMRQPLEWYRDAFEDAKKILSSKNASVRLFTDGDPATIVQELNIRNLSIDKSQNALDGIISLSKAKLVIGSRSTFSMWSVFMGNTLAIWDSNFDLKKTFPIRPSLDHFC